MREPLASRTRSSSLPPTTSDVIIEEMDKGSSDDSSSLSSDGVSTGGDQKIITKQNIRYRFETSRSK